MKRVFLTATLIVASVLAGGITAYHAASKGTKQMIMDSQFASTAGAGVHFTSYSTDSYPDLTFAAENAVKAVVSIENMREVRRTQRMPGGLEDLLGIPQQRSDQNEPVIRTAGTAAGVIISPDGYIVTNNHVVENAQALRVTLNDTRIFEAKVIGTDPNSDIALIKIDADDLPTVAFGDSEALRLGEWVLAIGSPFNLRSTVTVGIVSAKSRNYDMNSNSYSIESFIQTDAAVNRGNSGGALVDTRGNLVGINTAIISQSGEFIGYTFAVPSNLVRKVVNDLKEFGIVQRALLGVSYQEINGLFLESTGRERGIREVGGVYINEVLEDGAAKAAGVEAGDVLLEIDGVRIESRTHVAERIGLYRPGDKVNLTIKRGNQTKQIEVTLRNRANRAELLSANYVHAEDILGGQFANLSDGEKSRLQLNGGIRVVSVKADGLLARARIRNNFVITHINEIAINSLSDLARIEGKIGSIDGKTADGVMRSYSLIE